MKEKTRNPGKIFEVVFCIIYLIYIFLTSLIFFINSSKGLPVLLFGFLALILGIGDSFHLIPRILIILKGDSNKYTWYSGLGLMISSIIMIIFYIILFYIFKALFPNVYIPFFVSVLIWITALLRIGFCLFSNNNWFNPKGNFKWSLFRNILFVIIGICLIYVFLQTPNSGLSYKKGIAEYPRS